jgi:hypothetical protein
VTYFAKLDSENQVVAVIHAREASDGKEDQFSASTGETWRQTSDAGEFRAHYAGIGYSYDPGLDVFIPPRPYPSWTLNEGTADWEPPTPQPDGDYVWDENTTQWEEVE